MKIILSRKGFDSENGGIASPILPDGTLLSLPIPYNENSGVTYSDIKYGEKTYLEIINELNEKSAKKLETAYCHVDPDIYPKENINWKPAFGQCNASESHLRNQGVSKGDIFLFYGWFRRTEYDKDGKLRYVKRDTTKPETLDVHAIFGYLQIGDKIEEPSKISEYSFHPHSKAHFTTLKRNALYIPSEHLSFSDELKGYGTLKLTSNTLLTKKGHKRSEWELPDSFRKVSISYHDNKSFGWLENNDYFSSAQKGQEFVLEATPEIEQWVKNMILDGKGK